MEPQRQLDRLLGLKLDRYADHVARQLHAGELLRADRYVHDRNAGKKLIPSLQQKFERRTADGHDRINLRPRVLLAQERNEIILISRWPWSVQIKKFVEQLDLGSVFGPQHTVERLVDDGESGQHAVVRIEDEHVSGRLCGERQRGGDCHDDRR